MTRTIRTQTRGYRAADDIAQAVDYGAEFKTGGSLDGHPVKPHEYGIGYGIMPRNEKARFERHRQAGRIDYVIYSYLTPIAYRLIEDPKPTNGKGDEQCCWIVPNVTYSITTSRHQGLVRWALGKTGTPVRS